jgi:ribosomal protein S18 acetylase RimI-like enzyme
VRVLLRPIREGDLDALAGREGEGTGSPYDDFGFRGVGAQRRAFAVDGFLPEGSERGRLAIEAEGRASDPPEAVAEGRASDPPEAVAEGRASDPPEAVAEGALAGSVSWHLVHYGPNEGSRAFNLGIVLFPDQRGKGIGTRALVLLARYLFDHTTVHRLEGSTDVDNAVMQRVVERAGFRREGVLRGAQFRLGGHHDLVLYSLLRGELA